MRNLILSGALVAGLVLSSTAFAATTPATGSAGASTAKPAAAATASVDPKTAACQKEWKAQKTHKQSEKAFVKACLAKTAG